VGRNRALFWKLVHRLLLIVRDKLQKGSIRIPKVNRNPSAASAGPRDWTEFDIDSMRFEMVHGLIDRAGPFKTEIASAGRNRNLRQRCRLDTRAMQIQLRVLKPVRPPLIFSDNFNSDNFAIKRVRLFPVRDVDNAMIKSGRRIQDPKISVRRSAFNVRRSTFRVQRSALNVPRSPFAVRRSPLRVRCSPLTVRENRPNSACTPTRRHADTPTRFPRSPTRFPRSLTPRAGFRRSSIKGWKPIAWPGSWTK